MLDCVHYMNTVAMKRDREEALTLEILEAIDRREQVSQRRLADELGVALGLANSYLRRCVRKGLIKIQQAPANRYVYYLTPQGLAEKSRLTAQYLKSSLDYYHRAGASIADCYADMVAAGHRAVAFAGMSELSEIASIRSHDFPLRVVGTYDPGATVDRFIGRPVCTNAAEFDCDAVLFTALANPDTVYACLNESWPAERIFVPSIVAPVLRGTGHAH